MSAAGQLSYQEMLRTLGGVLDTHGSAVAVIHLSPTSARVSADVAAVREEWNPEALAAESERQRRLRVGSDPAGTVPWARRLGWQLRLVGAALDIVGPGPYTVMARPEEVYVFNQQGYRRGFRHTALERRAALSSELRGQPTTCPVCDEPEALVALMHDLSDEDVLGGAAAAAGTAQPTHRCRLCGNNVRLSAAAD
jgi:hypothetical protein